VVLATGLGKTWLAAFDASRRKAENTFEFPRVLFVAHRDEILHQSMRTFRKIRPESSCARYDGSMSENQLDRIEMLFASVQTLGRVEHLRKFQPDAFDYIVIDEFHHAAATTYRRLIDHFEPKFLLGLTATPERTDGGDLLGLCQENLVYRCDLVRGIQEELLSPFEYYGVPDRVDYTNIPWRSRRFDEAALTSAVSTHARAQNALEQLQRVEAKRTIGFCCSQQHADFMAEYFRKAGMRVAAVHSGPESDPRSRSLEALERGELDIVFAVDMFNEGLDIPSIDTVLMLRPTESSILWLQQFGRGLRKSEGKERLKVVDYIGNHRTFLIKLRSMMQPLLKVGESQPAQAVGRFDSAPL
jgi:superfamily II DNA or RNA helicase